MGCQLRHLLSKDRPALESVPREVLTQAKEVAEGSLARPQLKCKFVPGIESQEHWRWYRRYAPYVGALDLLRRLGLYLDKLDSSNERKSSSLNVVPWLLLSLATWGVRN